MEPSPLSSSQQPSPLPFRLWSRESLDTLRTSQTKSKTFLFSPLLISLKVDCFLSFLTVTATDPTSLSNYLPNSCTLLLSCLILQGQKLPNYLSLLFRARISELRRSEAWQQFSKQFFQQQMGLPWPYPVWWWLGLPLWQLIYLQLWVFLLSHEFYQLLAVFFLQWRLFKCSFRLPLFLF